MKISNVSDIIKEHIKPHQTIGIGGNTLNRAPMALIREIVRSNIGNLHIVKTAGAHDVDLLCRAELVNSVVAGFISYETELGLAKYYRKSVEEGKVLAFEHACYTVMSALTGGKMNTPFIPVHGLRDSHLIDYNDYFQVIEDPFTGVYTTVVKSISPDVALIHVNECDSDGNAIIYGPKYDDVLISRASKKVIISTERIISKQQIRLKSDRVCIPGFLVQGVVHIPRGASPCAMADEYNLEKEILETFISKGQVEDFNAYINSYERIDRREKGMM